uniref:Stress-response A/B barrel domain-containing protein n=1 Tax=Chaetoceros debilis TaxID=122233 RepID=A0A7S3PXL9_9STRA
MRNSIEHVVLLKIRDDALRTQIEEMMIAVKSLTKISGVLQVSTGGGLSSGDNESCTFLDSSSCHGFNHVLCVHLESKEALRVYQDHEYHIKIRDDFIKPLLSGPPIAVDWVSSSQIGTRDSNAVQHLTLVKRGNNFEGIDGGDAIFVEEWMSDRTRGYKSARRIKFDSIEALGRWYKSMEQARDSDDTSGGDSMFQIAWCEY